MKYILSIFSKEKIIKVSIFFKFVICRLVVDVLFNCNKLFEIEIRWILLIIRKKKKVFYNMEVFDVFLD